MSALCITKVDVLDGLESVSICTAYKDPSAEQLEPVYEILPGWQDPTTGKRHLADLPPNARSYLDRIEEVCGIPIDMISTGADREDTIVLNNAFH